MALYDTNANGGKKDLRWKGSAVALLKLPPLKPWYHFCHIFPEAIYVSAISWIGCDYHMPRNYF